MSPEDQAEELEALRESLRQFEQDLTHSGKLDPEQRLVLRGYAEATRRRLEQLGDATPTASRGTEGRAERVDDAAINAELRKLLDLKATAGPRPVLKPHGGPATTTPRRSLADREQAILAGARRKHDKQQRLSGQAKQAFRAAHRRR